MCSLKNLDSGAQKMCKRKKNIINIFLDNQELLYIINQILGVFYD